MLWVLNFNDNPCKRLGSQNDPSLSPPLYHLTGYSDTSSCHGYWAMYLSKEQINEAYHLEN